jgi:mono/diheme cytochrome c family protein
MRALLRTVFVALALIVIAGVAGVWWIDSRGFGAREQPSRAEEMFARRLRDLAVPERVRDLKNAAPDTAESLRSGMEHYADHCAVCHANDGSGETQMGRGMYPKVPDMRLQTTQSLADGELYYIIEEGVRFTGMPGWGDGTKEGAIASWELVRFIRHLPKLSAEEKAEMERLNPVSRAQIERERQEREFLEGKGATKPSPPLKPPHSGHRHE